MRLSLPRTRYTLGQMASFFRQLQNRVRSLPGVQDAAIVNQLPMNDVTANSSFDVEGRTANSDINIADMQLISPDYFHVMGISLIRGRFFTDEDVNLPPCL